MGKNFGVFLCKCEGNISDVVDVEEVAEFAQKLEGVVVSKVHESLCSDEGQETIASNIEEKDLDGVVIGSCSPHFHEDTFREALRGTKLNQYLMEIANLREQNSWVHYGDPEGATEKAKAAIAMSLERVKKNVPLKPPTIDVGNNVMVIGAGIAGIEAALDLADGGHDVYLVEKEPTIGGRMAQLSRTFPTNDCAPCILDPKMSDVVKHPNIKLLNNAKVESVEGSLGNYEVEVTVKPTYVDGDACTACRECADVCPVKVENEFDFGLSKRGAAYTPHSGAVPNQYFIDIDNCVQPPNPPCARVCPVDCIDFDQKKEKKKLNIDCIVVATGYDLFDLSQIKGYNYSSNENILHSGHIERMLINTGPTEGKVIRPSDGKEPESIAFVLCSGSRDKNYKEYCSQICCMYSMKEAFLLKNKLGDDVRIAIFYTDIRAAGKGFEEYYNDVREKGVEFIRGRPSDIVDNGNGDLTVVAEDTILGEKVEEEFEMVVLAPAIVPNKSSEEIGKILRLPRSSDDFFKEAHVKYKPVDTRNSGVFLAGCARGPKDIPRSVADGAAAAARASRLLNKEAEMSPMGIEIDLDLCDGCRDKEEVGCVKACPFDAISYESSEPQVSSILCKGCGLCIPACHANAISVLNNEHEQILAEVKAGLSEKSGNRIIAFLDDTCGYEATDLLSQRRVKYTSDILPVRINDSALLTPSLILEAFDEGADGILIAECEGGVNEYSPKATEVASECVEDASKKMKERGIDRSRLKYIETVTGEPNKILNGIESLQKEIRESK